MRISATRAGSAVAATFAVSFITGCTSGTFSSVTPALKSALSQSQAIRHKSASTQLKHIVVVIQENRTVDDLFNGFCASATVCANTVTADPVSHTPLRPVSLAAPYSPNHDHGTFVVQASGGWSGTVSACNNNSGQPISCNMNVFAYVPHRESATYFKLATVDGLLSDATFQTNQGPTLPAHLYAIAGQSGGYDPDHLALIEGSNSCSSQQTYAQINMTTPYPGQLGQSSVPCKDFTTIFDLLVKAGHTWRYYSNSADHSFYSATQNIQHLYNSPNFIPSPTQFLTDVKNGQLEDVTFVMPSGGQSDHPGWVNHPSYGPQWVASVMNAIGTSPFWNTTAVVLWWDDWGGWYDHVKPPIYNSYELSFRVPLLVISPYAKPHYISHVQHEFGSMLKFAEKTFGLPSLGTTDVRADDLFDCFDFSQAPIKFKRIPAKYSPAYFLHQPSTEPDDS